jgi:sialidase-1
MKNIVFFILVFHIILKSYGQKTEKIHGFTREHFSFKNTPAWIMKPKVAAIGNPWVWRAHFPDWHTEVDSILLERGFHVVYINTNDRFGSPAAMQIWDEFYYYLISERKLAKKVALEGVSRGGLYVYAWAKRNPLKVSCIYAEAPVCDFKSWPFKYGSQEDWKALLNAYRFSEKNALAFKDNPIENLKGLAACKIPILHTISLEDKIVPNEENTFTLAKNYTNLGGRITIWPMTKGEKSLQGHHFLIEHPEKIADFIEQNSTPVVNWLDAENYHHTRTGLANCFRKFQNEKVGRVAFMGGSITESPGWRDKFSEYLIEKFPDTKFDFINA